MGGKSIQKNTIYSIIKSCSTVIFPLITFPYISRILLTDNVGKVNFGSSIVSHFSLVASLGITTYAVRKCSKVKENKELLGEVASEILSINICTTLIAYLALIVMLLLAKPLESYRTLIIIQSSAILFTTLGADWLNTTMEDFKFVTLRTFFFQVLSLALMFFFVKSPEDYIKYAFITVISSSGGNIVNMFYSRRYCKTYFTRDMKIKKHLPSIIMLFAMLLAQQVFVSSDTTILGLIKGDYEVGIYSISVKIYNIINTLMSSMAWVVLSQLSYAFSEKDYSKVNGLLRYVIGFTLTLGLPCVIGMGILAPQIVEIIAGPAYIDAATSLRILAISMAFSLVWGIIMNMILLPSGADRPCLVACAVSAMVNIITNLIFIPNYGFVAAAITTTISQLVGLIICVPHIDKHLKFESLKNVICGPIVGAALVTVYLLMCVNCISGLWKTTIVAFVGSTIIYIIIQVLLKNEWVLKFANKILHIIKNKKVRK